MSPLGLYTRLLSEENIHEMIASIFKQQRQTSTTTPSTKNIALINSRQDNVSGTLRGSATPRGSSASGGAEGGAPVFGAPTAHQRVGTPTALRPRVGPGEQGGEFLRLFDVKQQGARGVASNKFTNCLMKSGNPNLAENVLAKASMFIKMKLAKKRNQFGQLVREAISNAKPLVELNQGASARSRRKKPKAIPMSSRRGEKLAIQ